MSNIFGYFDSGLTGGTGDTGTQDYVTLDTPQEITGQKNFSNVDNEYHGALATVDEVDAGVLNVQDYKIELNANGDPLIVSTGQGVENCTIIGQTDAAQQTYSSGYGQNTFVGRRSGHVVSATSVNNTFMGDASGRYSTTGYSNTFIGSAAGKGITTGTGNTYVGVLSGHQAQGGTGTNNTCMGVNSGQGMTAGGDNVLIGANSGFFVTTGTSNVMIGASTGGSVTTTSGNTFIGPSAGINCSGNYNICIGSTATTPNLSGSSQICIGGSTETMFIRGGFCYKLGGTLTASVTLTTPLKQYYSLNFTTANQVITLPVATNLDGAFLIFKRISNGQAYSIAAQAPQSIVPYNSIGLISTLNIAVSVYQVIMVYDGTNWCVISQS